MFQTLYKYITIDNKILSGTPVVAGTRIPIERIKYLVKSGYATEDLRREYPHVDIRRINSLMAYLIEAGLDAFTKQKTKKSV